MNYFQRLYKEWKNHVGSHQSERINSLLSNGMTIKQYAEVMKQTYFQVRENPQLQALATVYFRGSQRALVKDFYRHAISEVGHDGLALRDIAALGISTESIPLERPSATSLALVSFAYYQITQRNPLGYLGYLFHLEFMATEHGQAYIELLSRAGVPEKALSFVSEHAVVDIGHNKLMEKYVELLVKSESDFQEVLYAAKVTAKLHQNMLEEAVDIADGRIEYNNVLSNQEAV